MTLDPHKARVWVTCVLVMILACVPVGRWQAQRAVTRDRNRIASIAALAGPLGGPRLSATRLAGYDCLLYRVGADPFAIELCFDQHGRLVEAIDRRQYGRDPRVGSVLYDVTQARTVVSPRTLLPLFQRKDALRHEKLSNGVLPGPFPDAAPVLPPAKHKRSQG